MTNLLGCAACVVTIGIIVAGYVVHMWHILRDIAKEEARTLADALFDDYVHHAEYRVHFRQCIGLGKGYESHARNGCKDSR